MKGSWFREFLFGCLITVGIDSSSHQLLIMQIVFKPTTDGGAGLQQRGWSPAGKHLLHCSPRNGGLAVDHLHLAFVDPTV